MDSEYASQLVVQPSTAVATTWDPEDSPVTTMVSARVVLEAHTVLGRVVDISRSTTRYGPDGTEWAWAVRLRAYASSFGSVTLPVWEVLGLS